jgi:hypothetical protein
MTDDFKDRLEAKKAQIRTDPLRERMQLLQFEIGAQAHRFVLYAALFIAVAGSCVIQDWWNFIGSKEYHQYKLRVDK